MNGYPDTGIERVNRIRADIRRYEASCGCELGSVFAIVSLVGYTAHVVLGQGQWPGWRGVGWVAVWVISLSVVGKLIGLAYARVRLLRLQAQLERELQIVSQRAAPLADVWGVRPVQLAGGPAGPSKE